MLVLVVTKTTNYELHGARVEAKLEQGRISKESLLRLKTAHDEHYATLKRLHEVLARNLVDYIEVTREHEHPPLGNYEAVITVGGDGTLLAASHRMVTGGRLYGIRSSPSSVGYLCCAGPDEIEVLVQGIVADTIPTVTVSRLSAEIYRVDTALIDTTPPVLNDFLYTNSNPAATTRYKLSFQDHTETHRSSGIWVATAAGSTAAILAAGGERRPIEDLKAQFKVRELYRLGHVQPRLDGALFEAGQDVVEIENRCPEAILALDGQHGIVPLTYGDIVRFQSAAPITLGRPPTAKN